MKKLNFWLIASLFVGGLALTACSSNDDNTPNDPVNPPSGESTIAPGTAVNPANMKMSPLSGFVKDVNGNVLSDVRVTSGTESVITGGDGGFVFDKINVVNGRTVVKFQKSGYVDVVRSFEQSNGGVMEVVLADTYGENATSSYNNSTSPVNMETTSGMKTALQADGYKNAATGEAFSGYVSTSMSYLNPDDEKFADMMPGGDLAAVRNGENGGTAGEQVQLISYGMTKVDLASGYGEKLQLAEGKPATLTFPVPEKFKDNKPAQIPLWSFNEATGLWEEEGIATYDPTLDAYVGTVTHFSWVNLDYPESRATLKITVKDDKGNVVPNVKVDVDGQRSVFTNIKGEVQLFVPTNTELYVTVHSADYGNYANEVKQTVAAITTAGETKNVEILLPHLPSISGKVTNTGVGSNITTLWLEYDGKETTRVHSDKDGQFYMLAPEYKGAAVLKVRAIDGSTSSYDITLDGKDQAFNITVNGSAESGGSATFKMKDNSGTYSFSVPSVNYETLSGVSIVDSELTFDAYAGDYDTGSSSVYLTISDYADGKQNYNNVSFSFNQGAGNSWLYGNPAYSMDGERSITGNTATVTRQSDGYYRFQLSGDAMLTGTDIQGGNIANATFTADFTSPLLMKGKNLGKVTSKDASFPSFTPWISGIHATAGLQITESQKLGKGVFLLFYNSENKTWEYADYLAFKNLARQALGEPVECYDAGDDLNNLGDNAQYDMCESIFYKNGKFIMVSFCPWRSDTEEEMAEYESERFSHLGMEVLHENHMARIHVHVLDGLNIGYDFAMGHMFK